MEIIDEEIFQEYKNKMNKKDDYFSKDETLNFTNIYSDFNAIFNATSQIFMNMLE